MKDQRDLLRRRAIALRCRQRNGERLMAMHAEEAARAGREACDILMFLDEECPELPDDWMAIAEKKLPGGELPWKRL